jgi:hypothetical protein
VLPRRLIVYCLQRDKGVEGSLLSYLLLFDHSQVFEIEHLLGSGVLVYVGAGCDNRPMSRYCISGNPLIDLLGVLVMEEVGVVHKDLNWFLGTEKEVPSICQSEYES